MVGSWEDEEGVALRVEAEGGERVEGGGPEVLLQVFARTESSRRQVLPVFDEDTCSRMLLMELDGERNVWKLDGKACKQDVLVWRLLGEDRAETWRRLQDV
ncbi:unnamed protein product [Prorocentrum cordatum]|uniref:Uncharacterized protein n=1 Tax=Prorocentrum cordatum TaxID=2364126 RepID=A0ABN9UEI6_9DINO|nr:unnamed protein product [Polarella glacialis]